MDEERTEPDGSGPDPVQTGLEQFQRAALDDPDEPEGFQRITVG